MGIAGKLEEFINYKNFYKSIDFSDELWYNKEKVGKRVTS